MWAHSALPEHHLSADSKDVAKLGVALIATMSTLVLSLLVASAKSAYDARSNQLVQVSADIILLDRALARYRPETREARASLQRSAAATVERFWPAEGVKRITIDPNTSPVEVVSTTSRPSRRRMTRSTRCKARLCHWRPMWDGRACCCSRILAARSRCRSWWYWCSGCASSLREFRDLCAEKRNRDHCPLRLCAVGFRCDLSDLGARPVLRRSTSGLGRTAARGSCSARPLG
jgi:hypothetical protein